MGNVTVKSRKYNNIAVPIMINSIRKVYRFRDGKCEMPEEDAYYLISNQSGYYIEGAFTTVEQILALNPFKEIKL